MKVIIIFINFIFFSHFKVECEVENASGVKIVRSNSEVEGNLFGDNLAAISAERGAMPRPRPSTTPVVGHLQEMEVRF